MKGIQSMFLNLPIMKYNNVLLTGTMCRTKGTVLEEHLFQLPDTFFPTAFYNVNAEIGDYHTELDSTYTVLYVPYQTSQEDATHRCTFNMLVNPVDAIKTPMRNGKCIYFHPFLVTHRQAAAPGVKLEDDQVPPFVNFSAYSNQHVLNSSRKSATRVLAHGLRYVEPK